jgi:hypothetical protein
MGFAMNSGFRVRESIRTSCAASRCARTFSRRTVDGPRPWKAEEESNKHREMCRVGDCVSRFADETNPLRTHSPTPAFDNACIRQRLHSTTPVFDNACPAHTTRTAASSKAHDKDGTTNKEFYR